MAAAASSCVEKMLHELHWTWERRVVVVGVRRRWPQDQELEVERGAEKQRD
jgi:hypothetical protein